MLFDNTLAGRDVDCPSQPREAVGDRGHVERPQADAGNLRSAQGSARARRGGWKSGWPQSMTRSHVPAKRVETMETPSLRTRDKTGSP